MFSVLVTALMILLLNAETVMAGDLHIQPGSGFLPVSGLSEFGSICPPSFSFNLPRTALQFDAGLSGSFAAVRDLPWDNEEDAASFNLGPTHKYIGYATLVAALLTGVSKSSHKFHCRAAKGTAALAGATVVTGFVNYGYPAFRKSNLMSERMMHSVLGTVGMLGCAASVYLAENDGFSSHGGLGVAGAVLMTGSVVRLYW